MSVSWVLIVVIVVMVVALLLGNIYVLVYFQHDDDKNTAYFPKLLVVRMHTSGSVAHSARIAALMIDPCWQVFGLFFAQATVLMLPLDVVCTQ